MTAPSSHIRLSLAGKFLRAYHRSNVRGQTLVPLLLARRMKSLQAVSINIADWPPIYMDMRYLTAHPWFFGTPFESSPHEVNEQAVMRRFVRPGTVVFDIGANLGLHTVLLAQLVGLEGLVMAFEPNPELFPMLERTIDGLSNTTLYPCALSDQNVESTLFVPDDHSMGSLADWTKDTRPGPLTRLLGLGRRHTLTCRQRRLDELMSAEGISHPDFIKCDVEGAELMVFKGGRDTLNRPDAPTILFEAGVDSARGFDLGVTEAADFLASLGQPSYQFLEVLEGAALRPVRPANFKRQNQNVVAVPKAKSGLCPELATSSG
jgi:FkbM family methyltransferase